jgi:Spy/CpxP family protein refolding chaperone
MKRLLLPMMLLLGGAPAFASPAPAAATPAKQELTDARIDAYGARLGLDAGELERFRATMVRYRTELLPLRSDARAARASLGEELAREKPDDGKLTQLSERLANDRERMRTVEAQRMSELRRELTPQQYAKLLLSRSHHDGRRGHRHGQRRAGRHGASG